ncbi:MAG TPA: hypothetical protein VJN22_03120, partial [Candidatus Eremiobacteraceae bacterium]|nr:hypothetical protein [Candidatus Eremiobacteraceae bacterium]
ARRFNGESVGGESVGGESVGGESVGGESVGGESLNGETLNVRLCGDAEDARRLGRLRDLVSSARGGPGKIVLHAGANGDRRPLKQCVTITDAMRDELAGLFGGENVWRVEER